MAADPALRTEFTTLGAKAFLGKYFVSSRSGGGHQTYRAQQGLAHANVGTLAGAGVAPIAQATRGTADNVTVNLNPPALWALFEVQGGAARQIDASRQLFRANVNLQFDDANVNGAGVECYVLPSQGDGAIGIQLPAGGNARYMFTTTQDGCTVQVSGAATSPYVSHTNVSTTPWANKPAIIQQRLLALQAAFVPVANRTPLNDPTIGALEFGYFDVNDPNGQGFVRRNNTNTLQTLGNLLSASSDLKVRHEETVGHTNVTWHVSQHTHNTLSNPNFIPNALVIGERAGPGQPWSFYYQESTDIELVKRSKYKIGSVRMKTEEATVAGRVILSYGRLWPTPTTAIVLPMY